MRDRFALLILIAGISGCETFDNYDRYGKNSTQNYRVVSIEDDFDANGQKDAQHNYSYSKDGYIAKVSYDYLVDGVEDFIYSFNYSTDGYLTKESIDYNADGKNDLTYSYTYSNNLISRVDYDYNGDGNIDYIYSYSYNSNGYIASYKIESAAQEATNTLDTKEDYFNSSLYFCDYSLCLDYLILPSSNLANLYRSYYTTASTSQTYSNSSLSGNIEYKYSYNSKGLLDSVLIDSGVDGTIDTIYTYYYNDKNILYRVGYDYGADGIYDYMVYYNYNQDNLIEKILVDYDNSSTIDIEYTYRYSNKLLQKLSVNYLTIDKVNSSYRYNYDSNTLLISIDIDSNNDSIVDRVIRYNYMPY